MTQTQALQILKTGASVFLTGEPGSGKTHTVNTFVSWLRERGIEPSITASTGVAATHIGGYTIHSWSGIGIRKTLSDYDLDAIAQNKRVYGRVRDANILIIDEVSMLSDKTCTMVDAVCRAIRQDRRPFGGLTVVLVGDFFQLPPVSRREDEKSQHALLAGDSNLEFAFSSRAWKSLSPLVCYLSEQYRQEDAKFLDFLSAVRQNTVSQEHKKLLRTRYAKAPRDGVTQLYSHNEDVNHINETELEKLAGDTKRFEMESRGPEKLVAALKRGCLSPELLSLKIGARVMFTKNDVQRKFVNGTLGEITGFEKEGGLPVVKMRNGRSVAVEHDEWRLEDGGRVLARIIQIPLRLAWAITVHKSQGMSLDAAHMDLSQTFEYGQGYVALSRVRTLEGLTLSGLNDKALQVHPEIRKKDGEFREASRLTRETFAKISVSELEKMHRNFVRACGGNDTPTKTAGEKVQKIPTCEITKNLLLKRLSLADIAKERKITVGTIVSHLEELVALKKIVPARDLAHIKHNPLRFEEIKKAFETVYKKEGKMPLSSARAILGDSYNYDEIRLARLFVNL